MKLLLENWRRFVNEASESLTEDSDLPDSEREFESGERDFRDEQPLIDSEKQKFVNSYSLSSNDREHGAHAQAWIRALSGVLPKDEDPTEFYRSNVLPDIMSRIDDTETLPMSQDMFARAAGYYDATGIHMPDLFTGAKNTPQGSMTNYIDPSPLDPPEEQGSYFLTRHPKHWSLDDFVQHRQSRSDDGLINAQSRWGDIWAHEYGHHEDAKGPAQFLIPPDNEAIEAEELAREIWGDEYEEDPGSTLTSGASMSGTQSEKFSELFPWLGELDPEKGSSAHYERRSEIYASLMKNRQMMDDSYRRGERDTPMITAKDVEAWMLGPLEAKKAQAEYVSNWGKGKGAKARLSDMACRTTQLAKNCPSFIGSPMHRRSLGSGDVLKALWTSSPRGRTVRDDDPDRPLGWPEGKVGTGHPSRTDFPALETGSQNIADILNSIAQVDTQLADPQSMVAESDMKHLFENWRKYINEVAMGHDMAKSIEYTAFVLDGGSHQKLAQLAPEGWKTFAHHMTMIPPTEQRQRLPTEQFYEGCLMVTGIAQNERVIAVRVDAESQNLYNKIEGLPHITIATNPEAGGKPAMSNEFTEADFQPIEPIEVCGKVEEVMK
jgi:hypothetical protein